MLPLIITIGISIIHGDSNGRRFTLYRTHTQSHPLCYRNSFEMFIKPTGWSMLLTWNVSSCLGRNSCSGLSLLRGIGPATPRSPYTQSGTLARVPVFPVTLTPSIHLPTGESHGFGKVWFLLWGKSSTSDATSGWQYLLSPGAQGHQPWAGRAGVGQGGSKLLQLPGVDLCISSQQGSGQLKLNCLK